MPEECGELGSYEYGGQTWCVVPWVIRTRQVRLVHELADTVDKYVCRWPNALEDSDVRPFRTSVVYGIGRDKSTGVMDKDAQGIHTGFIRMHLMPGQDPAGEVRCTAARWDPPETRTNEGYKTWKATHPDDEPTWLTSDWSNPQPLGVVEPDPVPEPGIVVSLFLGVLALAAFSKVFRRRG